MCLNTEKMKKPYCLIMHNHAPEVELKYNINCFVSVIVKIPDIKGMGIHAD
jgi:hypothetical protein